MDKRDEIRSRRQRQKEEIGALSKLARLRSNAVTRLASRWRAAAATRSFQDGRKAVTALAAAVRGHIVRRNMKRAEAFSDGVARVKRLEMLLRKTPNIRGRARTGSIDRTKG